jgi:hypothetical protein
MDFPTASFCMTLDGCHVSFFRTSLLADAEPQRVGLVIVFLVAGSGCVFKPNNASCTTSPSFYVGSIT